jgi:alkyldihydroxyacetonephosphate synthase
MESKTYYERKPLPENVKKEVRAGLVAALGDAQVSEKEVDLAAYSRDFWPITLRWTLDGKFAALADFIAWPENAEQVSAIVKLANKYKIPIIPFGEGSGVMGGAIPCNGGIIVDMKRMNKILEINDKNLTATVQTGFNGRNLERELNNKGYTMAHIPQSVNCSTLGGYVACRAAGQFSTKYGKIEDMLFGIEAVLPDGTIAHSKSTPRSATGPRVDRLLIGAEGILGIVTSATVRIWPMPEKRVLRAFAFDKIEDTLEAIRQVLRNNIYPAVIRIYDEMETARHFYKDKAVKGKVMTIFVMEGEKRLVDLENATVEEKCKLNNGKDWGEEPVKDWFETRFKVKESSEFPPHGFIFDTLEVSVGWDNGAKLYHDTIAAMASVEGVVVSSAHASHFYQQGVCFYFTFGGVPVGKMDATEMYQKVWDKAMESVLKNGGSISHHHGMGIQRARFLPQEIDGYYDMLLKIKQAIDPNGIMNPGKVIRRD